MTRRQGPRHATRRPVQSFFWPVVAGVAAGVVIAGLLVLAATGA